jgi:hypothetical protein
MRRPCQSASSTSDEDSPSHLFLSSAVTRKGSQGEGKGRGGRAEEKGEATMGLILILRI